MSQDSVVHPNATRAMRGRRRPARPSSTSSGARSSDSRGRNRSFRSGTTIRSGVDPRPPRARHPTQRERPAARSPGTRLCAATRGAEARARRRRAARSVRARHRPARSPPSSLSSLPEPVRADSKQPPGPPLLPERAEGCWPGIPANSALATGANAGRRVGAKSDCQRIARITKANVEQRERGSEPTVVRAPESAPGLAPPDSTNRQVAESGADHDPSEDQPSCHPPPPTGPAAWRVVAMNGCLSPALDS